jgi:16S rRNA (cytosine967-C5)-methyltransferase
MNDDVPDAPDGREGPGRGPRGRDRGHPARVAALRSLIASERGRHIEDALAREVPERVADRGMAWHLALGVLRRRASIDAALRPALSQPLSAIEPEVRAVLRMGAFELLHAGTPPHAAVHEAVEAGRGIGVGRASSLINAVLRRVDGSAPRTPAEAVDLPGWLWDRWTARYGESAARAWATAMAAPPPLVIVARSDDDAEKIATRYPEAGIALRPARAMGAVVPRAFELLGRAADDGELDAIGRIEALPGYRSGAFWVQDAASASMADLVPRGAVSVLDACAAPGGKSLRMASAGHTVLPVDAEADRLERLTGSAKRVGFALEPRVHDWTQGPMPRIGRFDAVLVDAPCTGLGTARRHPEIKWARSPLDPGAAALKQRVILAATAQHVAPGGCLIHVVCSAEPEEGSGVVSDFLSRHPEFRLDEERCSAPPTDGEDGFYGARMVRA